MALSLCDLNQVYLYEIDPPTYVLRSGTKIWTLPSESTFRWWDGEDYHLLRGIVHREQGPAVIDYNDTQSWWVNGQVHRADGPAIIYANGHQLWYYQDKRVDVTTQEEFDQRLKLRVFT